jgi:hypothetical protein
MSQYSDGLSRDYIHSTCGGVTRISGDDYVILECPFRGVSGTYCVTCEKGVPLEEVAWADTGQKISEYRKEIAASVSFSEKIRLAALANAYEGALRLNLDAQGNPKGIVSTAPAPADHVEVVGLMKELGDALTDLVPTDTKQIHCEIARAPAGAGRALQFSIFGDGNPVASNNRVDLAGSRVVRKLSPSLKAFPGLTMLMERLDDGRWHSNVKLAESGGEPN